MTSAKTVSLGKRNAAFQVFQSLRSNRNNRHREKRFIVEGVKALNQLLESRWPIEALLMPEGKLSPWAERYADSTKAPEVYRVSPELMAELSAREEASEILAIAGMPDLKAEALPRTRTGIYVVADRPNSPGNLGTLIRTAEAFGAEALLTYGHAADFFDPKCINASIGALFTLPIAHIESGGGFKAWLDGFRTAGIPVRTVGMDEKGDVEAKDLGRDGVLVIVVGNETDGLSAVIKGCCDSLVKIKMRGKASSLNAAVSGSILLYELLAR